MNSREIVLQIKKVRKTKGYSQFDMAEKLHMSQSAYAKIENGRTALNLSRLLQIMSLLDLSITALIAEEYGVVSSSNSNMEERDNIIQHKDQLIEGLMKEIRLLKKQIEGKTRP